MALLVHHHSKNKSKHKSTLSFLGAVESLVCILHFRHSIFMENRMMELWREQERETEKMGKRDFSREGLQRKMARYLAFEITCTALVLYVALCIQDHFTPPRETDIVLFS